MNDGVYANNQMITDFSSAQQLSADFIKLLHSNEQSCLIVLTGERFDEAVKSFGSLFREIKAAGGIIRNAEGCFLFIKRHGLWDLPKGKLEPDEKPESGALREVTEETGLANLSITAPPVSTFHIYPDQKGGFILKETYWYEMLFKGNETPVPQLEEDITEVRWFARNELDEAVNNTYLSLKELLTDYFAGKASR